jgi:hypothetical protein
MGAAAVSVTFQVLATVRCANSRPLVAVEPFRSVAIDHGTAPLGARSSPNATQRPASIAESNRRWLSIRKSVSGLPKVMRLNWLALADVPISRPPWTFQVPSTADQPAGNVVPSKVSLTVGVGAAAGSATATGTDVVRKAVMVAPVARAASTARGRRDMSIMANDRRKPTPTTPEHVMN